MDTPKFISDKTVAKIDKYGMYLLAYGDGGSGKTYLGMTFPAPIFYMDTEERAVHTKEAHFPDKEIYIDDQIRAFNFNPGPNEDAFDSHKTVENMTRFIIGVVAYIKEKKLEQGTIVIDSGTDGWIFIQDWMVLELAKYVNKDGTKKADVQMMRVNNMLDWKIANKRNLEIFGTLRRLLPNGINVVVTAREEQPPEFVMKTGKETMKDRIRCHKDLPFTADVILNLRKLENQQTGQTRYVAKVEKLGAKKVQNEYINEPTYEKIRELFYPKKAEQPEVKI